MTAGRAAAASASVALQLLTAVMVMVRVVLAVTLQMDMKGPQSMMPWLLMASMSLRHKLLLALMQLMQLQQVLRKAWVGLTGLRL